MKNFTLLLSAAMLMGATASAAGLSQKLGNVQNPAKMVKVENTRSAFNIKNTPRNVDFSKVVTQHFASRADEDLIFDPEGEAKDYSVSGMAWEYSWFGLTLADLSGMSTIVWGNNGDVYIKNIVNVGFDTYVKGTYADGKIRVDFPQSVYFEDGIYEGEYYTSDYYVNVCKLDLTIIEPTEDEEGGAYLDYVPVDEENYAIYNVDENGVVTLDLIDWEYSDEVYEDLTLLPERIIGLMVDDSDFGISWAGYGTILQSFEPFNYTVTELPEGVKPESWVMKYYDTYGDEESMFVKVAIDGQDIYLGGFDEDIYGWAKGLIDGDKVTFESEQYLGYMDLYQTPIFFMTGYIEEELYEDEDGEEWIKPLANFTSGIVFKYDAEAKRLETSDDITIILNANTEELYFLDMYTMPTIYQQDPALINAAPLTPEMVQFTPWSVENYGGQGEMVWSIPAENVNGELLDPDRMYYHILYDGEVYPLSPDEYPSVEEEIWDIPYFYTDYFDISAGNPYHYIWFYIDGVETYGCQSFYVGSDGVTYASEIGIYVEGQTGIDGVKEFSKVVSTTYYDLSGREVANPQAGLYIQSMKLENGKVMNVKVSVK